MESKENANEFPLPQSDDKDKALPSQVLEYYKKYSQNRELPKYFCGTSSSFKIEDWHDIPPRQSDRSRDHTTAAINTEEIYEETIKPSTSHSSQTEYSNWTRPPLIGQDHLCEPPKVPDINVISDNVCVTSPTSSVASNRKLEWDNGADIGYNNVETHKVLQKSISLPVLSNLEYGELQKNLLRLSPEGNNTEGPLVQQLKQSSSEKSSNSDIIGDLQTYRGTKPPVISFNPPYSSSTSESIKSSNKNYISSSSSSAGPQQKQYFSDSDSSSEVQKSTGGVLKFLKEKVGLPLAESTPIIRIDQNSQGYSETPKLIKPKKGENNFKILGIEGSLNKPPAQNTVVDARVVLRENSNLGEKFSNSCENLSSPKTEEGLKKWHSQIDLNMVDHVSHYKNLKILKLSVSKPAVVECLGIYNALPGKDKFIQTSLPRNASIAIQTDFDDTNGKKLSTQFNKSPPKYSERQSIFYICHSDSDKERNATSSGTQTNSDALSKCNSFEYLYGADYDQNLRKPPIVEDVNQGVNKSASNRSAVIPSPTNSKAAATAVMDRFLLSNLKRCPPKSDLTTLTPDSDKTDLTSDSSPTTSKESPLAELIASKQSEHLIPDLHRNLQLLQKVIKSKKYDSITKKYCLKKLVQKMVDSKYDDDSLSSYDTSEKSHINKLTKKSSQKEKVYQAGSEHSGISSKDTNTPVEETNENKTGLHDNKPWLPVQQASGNNNKLNKPNNELPRRKQTQMKTLQTQTFTNEILPTNPDFQKIPTHEPSFVPFQDQKPTTSNFVPIQLIHDEKTRLERNPLFTITDHGVLRIKNVTEIDRHDHGDSSNSTENELYEMFQPSASETVTPLMSSSNSCSLKQNGADENGRKMVHSWRDDKTRSEQLLEQKSNETGDFANQEQENKDHLVHFAKKEREHQLCWINNEISHLSKLKKLLERREKPNNMGLDAQHKVLQTILEKPRIEDIKGRKKSTTVYVVTTERSSERSQHSSPHSVCDLQTCQNPRCQGRFVTPTNKYVRHNGLQDTDSGTNQNICKCEVPERVSSPKQTICECEVPERVSSPKPTICKCEVPPCTCKSELPNLNLKPPSLVGRGGTIANIGNEVIDLQNARLVSSEQFTTGNNSDNRRTSIRRYTFEIPLENNESAEPHANHPRQIECPCLCLPKRTAEENEPYKRAVESNQATSSNAASPSRTKRLSCELVVTDEIVGGEKTKPTSPQRCTCAPSRSTSPQQAVAGRCNCDSKKTQTSESLLDVKNSNSSCSSSSESDSASETSSMQLCRCCKRKCDNMLRARLEENSRKTTFCHPCYHQNKIHPCYMYPGHVCTCYNARQAETVKKMRNTIHALENLEEEEEYCKCCAKAQSSSGYCAKCKCKLNKKHKKPKGGMAYVLTLEPGKEKPKKSKKNPQSVLGEFKIKVVSPTSSNKQGELSNACSDACRSSEGSPKESSTQESEYYHKKDKRKKKKSKIPTLQEYLCENNPDFVAAAEQRRKCLLDLAYMREQRCQKYKQLLALTNGIPFKNSPTNDTKKQHVFSSKEMKQLTAKHYKKLPEVQQKLIINKENQIKQANKLLADIFNQNLRQQVLKGKHTLPSRASIIKLV